jgi:hypothetical protein
VLSGEADHQTRCTALIALALAELGPVSADRVLLCRALPDPLRDGPDGPCALPADATFALGHAAPAAALAHAQQLIEQRTCRRILLIAVDTLLDPASLDWLAACDRLRGPETPDGVQPGEAAAAWLLGPADPRALAQVEGRYAVGDGRRAPWDDAERWMALAPGVQPSLTSLAGEPWRGRVWGAVAQRLGLEDGEDDSDGWGDLGAASLLATASALIARGTRPCAVWGMSDDGSAGVIAVR